MNFSVNVFLLWWEYFTLKKRLDNTIEAQTLSAEVCNEHTFLILSILFTLFSVNWIGVKDLIVSKSFFKLQVIILMLVLAMRKRLNFLSTLFHESADCLSKLPALYWQPICTFSVLICLYAFWTAVILHLATASKLRLVKVFSLMMIGLWQVNKLLQIILVQDHYN